MILVSLLVWEWAKHKLFILGLEKDNLENEVVWPVDDVESDDVENNDLENDILVNNNPEMDLFLGSIATVTENRTL